MKLNDINPYTFKALRQRLGMPESREHEPGIIDCCRSNDSELCREMVTTFGLSEAQMRHAAERYRLGKSRSGKTIYWMIDEQGTFLDGHIGSALPDEDFASSWVSTLLKRRYPEAASYVSFPHCLFGLHLLSHTDITEITDSLHSRIWRREYYGVPLKLQKENSFAVSNHGSKLPMCLSQKEYFDSHQGWSKGSNIDLSFYQFEKSVSSVSSVFESEPVCVVESERAAVVLSELYPESLWLATGYPMNLTPEVLKPLCGRKVVLFPPTDESQDTYYAWLEVADQARHLYHLDISVSSILEDHCSPAQKHRCIDLLDFLFDPPSE